MTLIPELHDALARAVATSRPAPRRWRRPSRRAGLLAVGAVVVTGSAVAATTGWHPAIGDDHRGHPSEAHAGVPAAQIAALGVLRRAQTATDRGPQVQAVLRLLGRDEINGIHTDAIRTLRQHPNSATILVPTERVGRHDKGYASTIRRQVLCVLTGVVLAPRTVTITGHDGKPKTMHTPGGQAAGQSCGDLDQLRTTGIGSATGSDRGWRVGALVPDGVARVVIRLRKHHTLTAAVHDNYYEISTGKELPLAGGARWLDARGNTIDHTRIKQTVDAQTATSHHAGPPSGRPARIAPSLYDNFAVFRRPRTAADKLPTRNSARGTREQSRLVSERYGIKAWMVPGTKDVCLIIRAPKGWGSDGCGKVEDNATYKAGLRPIGSVTVGPISWRPHRRLVTLLLPDGTSDVQLRRGTKVTQKLTVENNAIQVRPMSATSIWWRAPDGSQRHLPFQ